MRRGAQWQLIIIRIVIVIVIDILYSVLPYNNTANIDTLTTYFIIVIIRT